jgi:hypothetical protein
MIEPSNRYFVILMLRRGGSRHQDASLASDERSISDLRDAARLASKHAIALLERRASGSAAEFIDLMSEGVEDLPSLPNAWRELRSRVLEPGWWQSAQGKYSSTADAVRLARQTRDATREIIRPNDSFVVLTNQELTLPRIGGTSCGVRRATSATPSFQPARWTRRIGPSGYRRRCDSKSCTSVCGLPCAPTWLSFKG